MTESDSGVFRQKTIDRMSSPDELTDYLKVTNPGVWTVLIAIVVLLAGILAWSCVGTLQTKADAKVVVQGDAASVLVSDPYTVDEGMIVTLSDQTYRIESTTTDPYGKTVGLARVTLPDGTYDGTVVVDETRAIDFLLQGNESFPG